MTKTTSLALSRFTKLVADISALYTNARKVQIQFAWQTGKRIVEEEQNGRMRAQYGARLIPELSRVLSKQYGPGFSRQTLQKMRSFYSLNPICPVPGKLEWNDYVELLPVKDRATRKRLEARILKENLDSKQVRRIVQDIRKGTSTVETESLPALKRPGDLKLNTFAKSALNVKLEEGKVLLDCGFFVNWLVAKDELKDLCVTDTPSYTYAATVDRVVDGDTLLVLIDVGFGIIMRDKLRLRGINCDELGTPEGEKAKRYVSGLLPAGATIILKSHKTKTDNYGRFVADVFYLKGEDDPETIIKKGSYLNQELLDEGYAVRMKE